MIYLLNSPIVTGYGLWRFEGPLSLDAVCARLDGAAFVSAIGHQATAQWLSALLKRDIPAQRITVCMQPGDGALVLRLMERLPEGKLLSKEELSQLPYEFGWLSFLETPVAG